MNKVDRIREKIAAGKLVKGFFLNMADPMVSEMAGYIGYDYVWIDAEHGPLDRQEIFHRSGAGSRLCGICQGAGSRCEGDESDPRYGTGRNYIPVYQ